MIPLSKHVAQILDPQGRPLPVDPVSVRVALDDEWSPYIQGRIVVHASDAAVLDRPRVIVRLRQQFGPEMSVAAVTEWAGGSVARLTAQSGGSAREITRALLTPWNRFERLQPIEAFTGAWGGVVAAVTAECGGSVAAVTKARRQPGGAFDAPASVVFEALVRVRPAESETSGLVEFAIDGEDIALHDYRRTEPTTWTSPHTRLRDLVAHVLGYVGGALDPSDDPAITAGATWAPGQRAWDALHPVLEAAGYRLTATPTGRYLLTPDAAAPPVAPSALDADENLIDYRTSTEPPYDGAVVEYNGVSPSQYDVHAPPGAQRIMHETRYTSRPGPGAAEQLTLRALARGRSARCTATSLYTLRPRQRVTIRPGNGVHRVGTIAALAWTYPQARMDITVRDLT